MKRLLRIERSENAFYYERSELLDRAILFRDER